MRPDLVVDLGDLEANSSLLGALHEHCFGNPASPLNARLFDAEAAAALDPSAFRAPDEADCAFGATGLGAAAVGALDRSYGHAAQAFRWQLEQLEQLTASLEERTRLTRRNYAEAEAEVAETVRRAAADYGASRVWE